MTRKLSFLHHGAASLARTIRYSVRPMPHTKAGAAGTARLLVILLAFAWGLNWIAAAVALREISPWSLRVVGSGIGAVTLFTAAVLTPHSLRGPRGEYLPVIIAGFFNVAAFRVL